MNYRIVVQNRNGEYVIAVNTPHGTILDTIMRTASTFHAYMYVYGLKMGYEGQIEIHPRSMLAYLDLSNKYISSEPVMGSSDPITIVHPNLS